MISNQILQNTIEGLKGITRIDFCVMDTDGKSLASTFSEQENYVEEVISFVESPADSQVVQGYQFFVIRVFKKIHGQKTGYSWPQATVATQIMV